MHPRVQISGNEWRFSERLESRECTANALITQRNTRSSVYTMHNPVAYMNMQFRGLHGGHETVISFDRRSCVNSSLLRALTACRFRSWELCSRHFRCPPEARDLPRVRRAPRRNSHGGMIFKLSENEGEAFSRKLTAYLTITFDPLASPPTPTEKLIMSKYFENKLNLNLN